MGVPTQLNNGGSIHLKRRIFAIDLTNNSAHLGLNEVNLRGLHLEKELMLVWLHLADLMGQLETANDVSRY